MGATMTKTLDPITDKRAPEIRVLMNGLDAAGKTTILYTLKLGEVVTTIPTIGFNVETAVYKNVNFTVWDSSSRMKIRPLFRHYFQNTHAVIWVIDANDRERLGESREELGRHLREDQLRDCVFLILCNKQDLPNAMSLQEIEEGLDLRRIMHGMTMEMFNVCATSGDGLSDAFNWLVASMKAKQTRAAKEAAEAEAQRLENLPSLIRTAEPSQTEAFSRPTVFKEPEPFADPWSALTDDELLESLAPGYVFPASGFPEKCREPFNHSVKLRFIWLHLSRVQDRSKGRKVAVDAIMNGLKAHEKQCGVFHMTAVYFWIQLVDLAIHLPADQQAVITAAAPAHPIVVVGMDAAHATHATSSAGAGAGAGAPPSQSEAGQVAVVPAAAAAVATPAAPVSPPATWKFARYGANVVDFCRFIEANYYLLESNLLYDYYSPHQILHTPATMKEFALPDKKALPSVLNFNVLS